MKRISSSAASPPPLNLPMDSKNLSTSPESRTWIRLWYACLILAAVLRVALIDRHGLWNNELITFRVLTRGYGEIIAERLSVNHMPFYFVIEKAWTELFGTSEASMRAIAAFFGWMAVWATGRLARRIGGLPFAIPIVFAAAIHQLWLSSSMEARMYSMVTWAAVESTDAWFAASRRAEKPGGDAGRADIIRWTLVTVIGIYTHMLYAVVLLLQLIDAAARWKGQGMSLGRLLRPLAVIGAFSIPISVVWWMNQNKFGGDSWEFEVRSPGVLFRRTITLLWGDYKTLDHPVTRLAGYLLCLLALVGCVRLLAGGRGEAGTRGSFDRVSLRDLKALALGYVLFLAGIFVAQCFSSSSMISEERYFAALLPAVLILGMAGLIHGMARFPRMGVGLACAALSLQALFSFAHYRSVGDGLREGMGIVSAEMPEGRGLVYAMSGGGKIGLLKYYGRNLPEELLEVDRSEESARVVREQLDGYTRRFPEFWVVTYHEKEDTVWRVLDPPRRGYEPLTDEREFGKTRVRLFASTSPADPSDHDPDSASAGL